MNRLYVRLAGMLGAVLAGGLASSCTTPAGTPHVTGEPPIARQKVVRPGPAQRPVPGRQTRPGCAPGVAHNVLSSCY